MILRFENIKIKKYTCIEECECEKKNNVKLLQMWQQNKERG